MPTVSSAYSRVQRATPDAATPGDLTAALKRCFGFDGFRPGQEAIVRDVLSRRDVLALMPTGGGKSLCFQLPALLQLDETQDGYSVLSLNAQSWPIRRLV